jgi:hypothetical protein
MADGAGYMHVIINTSAINWSDYPVEPLTELLPN